MSFPVVIVRPEPGCGETLVAARALGLTAVAAPLFEIQPVGWTPPDPRDFDALLVGSANVLRHGGEGLARLKGIPVLAVGERTAQAARAAGFAVEQTGHDNFQSMLDRQEDPRRYLRLRGEVGVELAAPPGSSIGELAIYRAIPLPLSGETAALMQSGALVLLHSGEAARRLASETTRLSIDRAAVSLATLAPRIAEAAGSGWREVRVSTEVSDAALLAMAADMCH